MKNYRIGNTVTIRWAINQADGTPYILPDNVELFASAPHHTFTIKDFTISQNLVSWVFQGGEQRYIGPYTLTLVANRGKVDMMSVDFCDAFGLVECSCLSDGTDPVGIETESLELVSNISMTQVGLTPEVEAAISRQTNEWNISSLYPTGGVDGGNTYTKDLAVAKMTANVPVELQKTGLKCTYIDAGTGFPVTIICNGTFGDASSWSNPMIRYSSGIIPVVIGDNLYLVNSLGHEVGAIVAGDKNYVSLGWPKQGQVLIEPSTVRLRAAERDGIAVANKYRTVYFYREDGTLVPAVRVGDTSVNVSAPSTKDIIVLSDAYLTLKAPDGVANVLKASKNARTLELGNNKDTLTLISKDGIVYTKTANGVPIEVITETNRVGKKTAEGGEIFNDYTNNKAGLLSHVEGANNDASANKAHAEGANNIALGEASHVEGSGNSISEQSNVAHAEGVGNKLKNNAGASHIEGSYNAIDGANNSHAEGYNNIIQNSSSAHVEGYNNKINIGSTYAHAEGSGNTIMTGASGSHVEGVGNTVSSIGAHGEGGNVIAAGKNAHAQGTGTRTKNEAEHAEGTYNVSNYNNADDSKRTRHSVGIGSSDTDRKNAQEIMANGDHYIIGIGGYDGTNPSAAKRVQTVLKSKAGVNKTKPQIVANRAIPLKARPGMFYFTNVRKLKYNDILSLGSIPTTDMGEPFVGFDSIGKYKYINIPSTGDITRETFDQAGVKVILFHAPGGHIAEGHLYYIDKYDGDYLKSDSIIPVDQLPENKRPEGNFPTLSPHINIMEMKNPYNSFYISYYPDRCTRFEMNKGPINFLFGKTKFPGFSHIMYSRRSKRNRKKNTTSPRNNMKFHKRRDLNIKFFSKNVDKRGIKTTIRFYKKHRHKTFALYEITINLKKFRVND